MDTVATFCESHFICLTDATPKAGTTLSLQRNTVLLCMNVLWPTYRADCKSLPRPPHSSDSLPSSDGYPWRLT